MRQFKLDKIKATGTTVGDVNFPKVKWLSAFDGSNGATSTSDSSNSNLSLTIQGSSQISTAQSKFGGSSLHVTNSNPEGVYAAGAGSTINLTGDFTIEYWYRRVQVTLADNMVLGPLYGTNNTTNVSSGGGQPYVGLIIGYYYGSESTSQGLLYSSSNGSSWNVAQNVNLGTGSLGTVGQWVHMALTRSGTTWNYYVDGTRTYTGTLGSDTLSHNSGYILLGKSWVNVSNAEGYYDDFRITQGLARYTGASFTVPTTAHLTSAGDVNKQIVVNSDADGVAIGTGGISQARIAKAWVRFDQTGSQSIDSSYNISSVTDTNTGISALNFSTAMTDANYSVVATGGSTNARYYASTWAIGTSSFQVRNFSVYNGSSLGEHYLDRAECSAIVFGN